MKIANDEPGAHKIHCLTTWLRPNAADHSGGPTPINVRLWSLYMAVPALALAQMGR